MQIDSADRRTPSAIRKALAEFGGYNRFNGANWRCIVAEDHLVLRGGVHRTMPSGDVKSVELEPVMVGGKRVYKMHHREVKPEKVETGWKRVPKWGVKGWVLERWFAPETVNRTVWEDAKSTDGSPMMGPYPEQGYYFMLAGPWEQMPELADLKTAIAMHIRMENEQPTSYAQMLLNEVNGDLEAERKAYDKSLADLAHFYESEVAPVVKGSSLGASRIRQELANAVGDFSHQGIA